MENNKDTYCDSFFSLQEIEKALIDKVPCLELNKISSAYELSEKTCSQHAMPDGSNFFYHTARVAEILIKELQVFDASLICAALLHNAARVSQDFSTIIVDYNFGAYVAYLVDIMGEEFDFLAKFPKGLDTLIRDNAKIPIDDYLILMSCEQLDYLRCIDYDITGNHFEYIENIAKLLFPLIADSENENLHYLYQKIKAERNKILS